MTHHHFFFALLNSFFLNNHLIVSSLYYISKDFTHQQQPPFDNSTLPFSTVFIQFVLCWGYALLTYSYYSCYMVKLDPSESIHFQEYSRFWHIQVMQSSCQWSEEARSRHHLERFCLHGFINQTKRAHHLHRVVSYLSNHC